MITFVARRWAFIAVFAVLAVAFLLADAAYRLTLQRTTFVTGWLLLVTIVLLACYNVRKKLTMLPLGSSATWLQVHIYTGWLTLLLFLAHIDYRLPTGLFECLLGAVYVGVFTSGVVGLFLSRSIPPRLATRGEEVLYERIPLFRNRLHHEVEELVLDTLAETESEAIADFYARRLKPFFSRPRHFWRHLWQSNQPLHALLIEIGAHERYLNPQERDVMQQIAARVRVKDNLDYQFAMQATLKYWLFFHIPLTYCLLVAAVFHVSLVYAFAGTG